MSDYRGVHDLGGLPIDEPIDRSEHEPTFFEKRVDALMRLLYHPDRGVFRVDEMRRAIESLPKDDYFGLTYYERWVNVMRQLLVEKGVLSEVEIEERMAAIRERLAAEGITPIE